MKTIFTRSFGPRGVLHLDEHTRSQDVGDTSHDTENIMLYYTLHYTLLLLPHTSHDTSHETRSSQRHKRSNS